MFVLLGLSLSALPWMAVWVYLRAAGDRRPLPYLPHAWLLWVCSVLFIGSFFLPDIHISSQTDTFQQHFVGGGFSCALLALYWQQVLKLRLNHMQRWLLLLAVACTLGVANEMLEFGLTELTPITINSRDTWWDLCANITGAVAGYAIIQTLCSLRSNPMPKNRSNR